MCDWLGVDSCLLLLSSINDVAGRCCEDLCILDDAVMQCRGSPQRLLTSTRFHKRYSHYSAHLNSTACTWRAAVVWGLGWRKRICMRALICYFCMQTLDAGAELSCDHPGFKVCHRFASNAPLPTAHAPVDEARKFTTTFQNRSFPFDILGCI